MLRSRLCAAVALFSCGLVQAAVTTDFAAGTLTVTSDGADAITLSCGGTITVNGNATAAPCGGNIVVNGGPGANLIELNSVQVAVGFAASTTVTINGNGGMDQIYGSGFADAIDGGSEDDLIDGRGGDDAIAPGAGLDRVWYVLSGGLDTVDDAAGGAIFEVTGTGAAEAFVLSPGVGGRASLTRDGLPIGDLDGVATIRLRPVGGADSVTRHAMDGTDVLRFDVNLDDGSQPTPDRAIDVITYQGSSSEEAVEVSYVFAEVRVEGAQPALVIVHADGAFDANAALDTLAIDTGAGDDQLVVSAAAAGRLALSADLQSDSAFDRLDIVGTPQADAITLLAASPGELGVLANGAGLVDAKGAERVLVSPAGGDDAVTANAGAFLGISQASLAGDDGSDTFTYHATTGADTMLIAGTPLPNVALITGAEGIGIDLQTIEHVRYRAREGADSVDLRDLAGSGIVDVLVDLSASGIGVDGSADEVVLHAGPGDDAAAVRTAGALVRVEHNGVLFDLASTELERDLLTLSGDGGSDVLMANFDVSTRVGLHLDGDANDPSAFGGDMAVIAGDDSPQAYQIVPEAGGIALRAFFSMGLVRAFDMERFAFDTRGGADAVYTQPIPNTRQFLDGSAVNGVSQGDLLYGAGNGVSPYVQVGGASIEHTGFKWNLGEVFEAYFTPGQEVPSTHSPAVGHGTATLNAAGTGVHLSFEFAGLAGSNTLSHVHGPAGRGETAPPIFDLSTSGTASGGFTTGEIPITPTQLADLRAGRWYFNVHSSVFANGEIRGQLDKATFKDDFE